MFTGIVQARGSVAAVEEVGGDRRLHIDAGGLELTGVELGGSIAVSGVCLTATEFSDAGFWADVSTETLRLTTLGNLSVGDAVNLERSLTPSSSLGGHWVSGHVDGIGKVIALEQAARSIEFVFELPEELARYVATKGSVCIDGTSLTVNRVDGARFAVNIIPHTMSETLFGTYKEGSQVNIEVDVIARYLERLSQFDSPTNSPTKGES